jgi:D-alanyl-D-alanine carboxypeptidase (penicillin-binding protein 5/6)
MVPEAPPVSAASFILFDETADWVIASGNPDARRPPASTTKMMTALVALEHASLDDIVTVTAEAAEAGEAEIGLVADERIPMGDLITAMLVRSANDAAEAVAIHVGGSIAGFADLMNQKAAAMGLENSHFMNPHGLDEPDHYTSAADLLAISRAVLADPQLAAIVRSVRMEFRPAPDGTERGGPATNSLLESYPGAIGIKTGYTSQASLVLAAAAERDQRQLVAVVMGSEGPEAHFADASELLDYGFDNARILPVLAGGQFAAGDISANPIAATARLEALAWLSASGLLTVPPAPNAEPVRVLREPAAVPDWKDAFSWLGRYWAWVAGDG